MEKQIAFGGFALLSTKEFDKNEILLNLRTMWKIKINPDTVHYEETEKEIKFTYEDMKCVLIYSDEPIKDGVVNKKAKYNYMYENSMYDYERHTAHILIGVSSSEKNHIETAMLFTKIASACMHIPSAIAIYLIHNFIDANSYIDEAMYIHEDFLPIENWLYVGLVEKKDELTNKSLYSAYTIGLNLFDKKEIEIIDSSDSLESIRYRILNIAYYIIDNDIYFTEDETITLNEEDENGNKIPKKYKVKISDSKIIKKSKTIKIENI